MQKENFQKKHRKGCDKKHLKTSKYLHNLKRAKHTKPNKHFTNKSNKEIAYISLDTNIIIDMINVINGRAKPRKRSDDIYFRNLRIILSNNVLNPDGSRNRKGQYALCIVPAVLDEISSANGELHASVKEFVEKRTLPIHIADEHKHQFEIMTNKLLKEYNKYGYFLDADGNPTMDGKIVGQSSMLNLTLMTRDHDIISSNHDLDAEKKTAHIKHANRKHIKGDFEGNQAYPRKVSNCISTIAKGYTLPKLQNFTIFDTQTTRKLLNDFKFFTNKQTKTNELNFK